MRILGFGSAKDHTKVAWSDATQIERLSRESMRIANEIEHHLGNIAGKLPPHTGSEEEAHMRSLEHHLDVIKRHSEQIREHLKKIDDHVIIMDRHVHHPQSKAA